MKKARALCWMVVLAVPGWQSVRAANPALQDLFFAACQAPSGQLADRCAETTDSEGNLSGDSESSLNPSQTLSGSQTAVRAAFGHAEDAMERAGLGSGEGDGARVDLGRWSLLFDVGYVYEKLDKTQDADSERGFDSDTWDVSAGFDYRLSDSSFAGLMFTYENGSLDFDRELAGVNFTPAHTAGSIDSENYGVTAFASFGIGASGYVDVSAGYQAGEDDYERKSVFQESTRVIPQTNSVTRGSADTTEAWASVNAGLQKPIGSWDLGLFAGMTYTDADVKHFNEKDDTDTGLAMRFGGSDLQSLVGSLGIRVQRAVSTGSGVFVPYLRGEYAHEFKDDAPSVNASYLLDTEDNVLQLEGDEVDQDYFIAGAGATMILPNGWVPFLDVSYWAGYQDLERVRVQAGLRKEL